MAEEAVSSYLVSVFRQGARIDVSYEVGGIETFILQGQVPLGSNGPGARMPFPFQSFRSANEVTWRFYVYGASNSAHGTRLDDIRIVGSVELFDRAASD